MNQKRARSPKALPLWYRLLGTVVLFIGCVPLGLAALAILRGASHWRSLPRAYFAFVLGAVLEFFLLCNGLSEGRAGQPAARLRTFGLGLGLSLVLSGLVFLSGKSQWFPDFDAQLRAWPYLFAGLLMAMQLALVGSRLTPRLGEGTTLLHSLTLVYWLVAQQRLEGLSIGWAVVASVPLLFALFHALTPTPLTSKDRLVLSLWSSVASGVLALAYVRGVLALGQLESLPKDASWVSAAQIVVEYFCLGASGGYIAKNLVLVLGFLPRRGTGYIADVQELVSEHIERYEVTQVERREAVFVILFLVALYGTSLLTALLSPGMTVWLGMFLVPGLLGWLSLRRRQI